MVNKLNKKIIIFGLIFLALSVPLVSAGFWDWMNQITGRATHTKCSSNIDCSNLTCTLPDESIPKCGINAGECYCSHTCTDFDGGKDYYVNGKTTGYFISNPAEQPGVWNDYYDFCNGGGTGTSVLEHYCGTSQRGDNVVLLEEFICPSGCKDGACVNSPPSIQIISPRAGETLEAGKSYVILYNQNDMPSDVWIGIVRLHQGANFLMDITPSFTKQPATGSVQWTINANSVTGNDFKIHIVANTGNVGSESNIAEAWSGSFSISPSQQNQQIACTDSDNGINYYVKGVGKGLYQGSGPNYIFGTEPNPTYGKPTSDSFTTYYDHCATDYQLNEAYCENGKLLAVGYQCQNGCKDGVCVSYTCDQLSALNPSGAFDTCGQQGFDKVCFNKYSGEYQGCGRISYNDCTVNNINAARNIWCDAATSKKCTDSDGGKDYYVKGTTSNSKGVVAYDACKGNELTEFYCAPDGEVYPTNYLCPNGCKDGACAQENNKFYLSDYPNMFIKGDSFNGILVVGDKAPATDVIAISDIISSLQYANQNGVIKRIPVGAAKLASEVNGIEQNIISVGSSCHNAITSQIEGYPQDCFIGLKPRQGNINIHTHNGYAHIIVKGYSESDTLAAAKVLANYKDYKLSGVEYIVDSPAQQQCTDSDGGKDYYTRGTLTYKGENGFGLGPAEDSCVGNEVAEWYCKDGGGYDQVRFLCPYGCKDGACLKSTCGNGVCEPGEMAANSLKEGQKSIFNIGNKDYELTLSSLSAFDAQFIINGQTTRKLQVGDADILADGNVLKLDYIENDYAKFSINTCPKDCDVPSAFAKENVLCVFKGSTTMQKCYMDVHAQGKSIDYGCSGINDCSFTASAPSGIEISIGSSCAGENSVYFDGKEGSPYYFKCGASSCGNGICEDGEVGACPQDCKNQKQIEPVKCDNGCLDANNNCMPIGTRSSTQFCEIDKTLKNQLSAAASCNNNYECQTNFCLEGKCTEYGFFKKLVSWFSRVFLL